MLNIQESNDGLRTRLVRGSLLNLVAMSMNQGSTLIVNILLARVLGQAVFGEYAIVQSTLLMAATFAELSLGFTAMKHLASTRDSDLERTGRLMVFFNRLSLGLGFVALLLVAGLSPWIASSLLNSDQLARAVLFGAPFLFFQTVNGYQIGALNGLESYRHLARAGIIAGVGSLLFISAGGYFFGRDGAVAGLSMAGFVRWLAHRQAVSATRKKIGIPAVTTGIRQELPLLISFTLPAALAAYLTVFSTWFGNYVLVQQEGGFAMMGIYAAANNLRFLVLFSPIVIGRVGFSLLSNQLGQGAHTGYRKVFRMNLALMFGVTAVSAGLLYIFEKPVLHLFGKDFVNGTIVLQILLLSTIFEVIRNALVQHLQSNERIWRFFLAVTAPRDLLFIGAALWAVPAWGAEGLAGTYLVTRTVELTLAVIQARRIRPVVEDVG